MLYTSENFGVGVRVFRFQFTQTGHVVLHPSVQVPRLALGGMASRAAFVASKSAAANLS